MTPVRQAFHAAWVMAGLCVAGPTFAEPLPPLGPPTAAEAADAAAAAAAVAEAPKVAAPIAASGKPPSWLAARPAPRAAATGKSSVPSTGRMIGLLLVIGSLGGAAMYLKRRGQSDGKRAVTPQRLSVLSSTRLGPKAHAVVISVAGRQMLLGVTDASVKRLAFIDEIEEEDSAREREPARRPASQLALRPATVAAQAAAPDGAKAGSFADLLRTAFGKRTPLRETDAASILAAETHDTVAGKVVSNVRMLDVEGQAQGLVRRLSGPRA